MSAPEPNSKPNFLIRTADLPLSALAHRIHPVNKTSHRYTCSLGDSTGLSKTAVHFCRLPAGATSTTLHYHTHEDEWMYILEAGPDAVALIWDGPADGDPVVTREVPVKSGDFLGFKGGVERAHAFRAGEKDMVYLVGGSREQVDVSIYPVEGKAIVNDSRVGSILWAVEDKEFFKPGSRKPPVVDGHQ